MRPELFRQTIPFDDALRRVLEAAVPVARSVRVSIDDATGRIAACDVSSPLDVPAFDRAAMDGYALRSGDVAGAGPAAPATLSCIDRIFTGQVSARTIGPGQCAEISTGAPMPPGADAVVMVERTSRDGDRISVLDAPRAGQNVGRRAGDIATGQLAIRAGDVISPARAGALTAVGQTSVDVFDRPMVAILSTGSEVAPPGFPLPPGHVYDVNSVTLAAIVSQHGGEPIVLDTVEDSIESLTEALQRAGTYDVIVTSGGSSVGGPDLLLDALNRCGTIDFHGIAVKPGKPTLFGRVGRTPLFGMPGNPTSCLSNAYSLLVPFLRKMAHLPAWQPVRRHLPLARAIAAIADRHQFYTVRIVDDVVEPAFKSSGDITSMAAADGYIEIPAGTKGFDEGETVTVTLL
ncbi:MAG: molybdopterin molybdotransferase MoeA [Acidobacteria bacterium]|nr:molybdopterin molybdotransferase MoeA [Acidobacteriota bacterium]